MLRYRRSWDSFLNFLLLHKIPLKFPYSENLVILYIINLCKQNLKSSTIRSYLTAIACVHKLYSAPDPTSTYLVSRLLKGNEQINKYPTQKLLPINKPLLYRIISVLPKLLPAYDANLFTSLFLLAYFFCLRSGEIVKSQSSSHTIQLQDLSISHSPPPLALNIQFKSFKHSLEPVSITYQPNSNEKYCPIIALLKYISLRGNQTGPLYISNNNRPLSRHTYASILKLSISSLGISPVRYNTHSFRIGRATDLASKGASNQFIKAAGRWRSDAYTKYIRPSKIFANY